VLKLTRREISELIDVMILRKAPQDRNEEIPEVKLTEEQKRKIEERMKAKFKNG
jgi:hypothetical protein